MAESFKLPYEYVNHLINPGLETIAGRVKLNQYLCKTRSNGGNDSAHSFYNNYRWVPNASGERIQDIVGGNAVDLALKGQGSHDTFVKVWNFLLKNKDILDNHRVEVCGRVNKDGTKDLRRKGRLSSLHFDTMSDQAALQKMVDDRFFGMDCIGFVSNFLMWVGELPSYPAVAPKNYPSEICKINIDDVHEVKPLDFMVWGGHVALVDWVWKKLDEKSVEIDMCQSSGGAMKDVTRRGPQCNEKVILRQTNQKIGGKRIFKIDAGTPAPPVRGNFTIWRREGFWY